MLPLTKAEIQRVRDKYIVPAVAAIMDPKQCGDGYHVYVEELKGCACGAIQITVTTSPTRLYDHDFSRVELPQRGHR